MKTTSTLLALAMLCQSASAFTALDVQHKRTNAISLAAAQSSDGDSRRDFFAKSTSAVIAAASGFGQGVLAPLPANAAGVDKVNARLKG
jgi:hypothetical protein